MAPKLFLFQVSIWCALTLLSLLTSALPAMRGAGDALFCNEQQFLKIDTSACGGNVFDEAEITQTVWARLNPLSAYALKGSTADLHIMGSPVETGTRFFLGNRGELKTAVTGQRNSAMNCTNAKRDELAIRFGFEPPGELTQSAFNFRDFAWHHVVMHTGPRYFMVLLDGRVAQFCEAETLLTAQQLGKTGPIFHIGLYDDKTAGNAQAWAGWIDEVRVYNRWVEPSELRSVMYRTDLNSTEQQGLTLWYDFDTWTADGHPVDKSPNGLTTMPDWPYALRPAVRASDAPLSGSSLTVNAKVTASGQATTWVSSVTTVSLDLLSGNVTVPAGDITVMISNLTIANGTSVTILNHADGTTVQTLTASSNASTALISQARFDIRAVSYTHLTLPTNREV